MYLGLQGTRILVGFWRVAAASSAESVHARDWSNDIRPGERLAVDAGRSNEHGYRFGCALEQPTACSWCLRVVLVTHIGVLGIPGGRSRFQGTQRSKRAPHQ